MFWRRLITTWLCLVMVLVGAGPASAASSAQAKPHQGSAELSAALHIWLEASVSAGVHTGNVCLSDAVTSDVPHAARGEQVLYRLITAAESEANFVSNAAKGLAPRGPEVANPALHQGLSMFDSVERAAAKVPVLEGAGHKVLGIAEVRIPAGAADVTFQRTLGAGHYTVTGTPGAVGSYWNFTFVNW